MTKRSVIFSLMALAIVSSAIAEYVLRDKGFIPGVLTPRLNTLRWFDYFSEAPIYTSSEFIVDQKGLLTYNKVYFDTCQLCPKSELFHYLSDVKINKWGYRTSSENTGGGKKVMLLGDSFTWGFSAKPIDSSFADILSQIGYQVSNFGIPGTDPVQYEAVAQNYIDSVSPDVVVVNFYAGNDFIDYDKKIIPGRNIDYFYTSRFWLPVSYYKDGDSVIIFDSEQNSQKYFFEDVTFGKFCHNPIHRILGKTVITTYLGRFICGRDDLGSRFTKRKYEDKTIEILERIVSLCQNKKTPLIISIIPNKDNRGQDRALAFKKNNTLNPFTFFCQLHDDDYMEGADDHFNIKGHREYAHYLDSLFTHHMFNPSPVQ